jgi:hypothetical protein
MEKEFEIPIARAGATVDTYAGARMRLSSGLIQVMAETRGDVIVSCGGSRIGVSPAGRYDRARDAAVRTIRLDPKIPLDLPLLMAAGLSLGARLGTHPELVSIRFFSDDRFAAFRLAEARDPGIVLLTIRDVGGDLQFRGAAAGNDSRWDSREQAILSIMRGDPHVTFTEAMRLAAKEGRTNL